MGKIKTIISLAVVAVVVGVPVGGYYSFVHDIGLKDIEYDENYDANQLFSDLAGDCLDKTVSDQKIALGISDTQLTNVLHNAIRGTDAEAYISQIYAEFKDGHYDFVAQLQPQSLHDVGTKIKISTTLKEEKREDYDNEDCLVFGIDNIAIGRINNIEEKAVEIAQKFVTGQQLEDMLGGQLSLHINLENKEIIYKKSDLKRELLNTLTSGIQSDLPVGGIFETFFDKDLVHLIDQQDNKFEIDIDCEPLTENSEYVEAYDLKLNDSTKYSGLTLDVLKQDLAKILVQNESKTSQATNIFSYLINGYSKCNAADKALIDELDLTGIGRLENRTEYKGFDLTGTSIATIAGDQVSALASKSATDFMSGPFNFIQLDEEAINGYMKSVPIIGYSFILYKNTASETKASYITIDNLYCNVYDTHTEFVAGLNLNGLETTMIMSSSLNTTHSVADFNSKQFKLAYTMGGLKLGSLDMPEGVSNGIYEIMASMLKDGMILSKNAENQYELIFDFSEAISANMPATLNNVFDYCEFTFETKGADKAADGTLTIKGNYTGPTIPTL